MRRTQGNIGGLTLPSFLILLAVSIAPTFSIAKDSLRVLADKKGIMLGAAAGTAFFGRDSTVFKANLKKEFNALVAEYQMKFGQIQPTRGDFNWAAGDRMLAYADTNHMKLRGHCLVWHKEAAWLETTQFSKEEMYAILKTHIQTVVGRYKGRIPQWDVVNEAISNNPDSTYRNTFLFQRMGIEFIDSCFRWARLADPDVQLFYNDYWNEGLGAKSDKVYNLLKGLKDRGVPVDGVGLQCHFRYDSLPSFADMDTNIKRLADLGLQVAFTEVDFRVPLPATPAALQKQKEDYQGALQVCLANPNCKTFMIWGVTDAYSWVPASYPGWGAALLLDSAYAPKPAYDGIWTGLGGVPDGILASGPPLRAAQPFFPGWFGSGSWDALGRERRRR
ncbi:MAG: endo-1,4-beta-xylanase [Fibrobacteres bacterium]|jgi:endo-1,4-beta-xylanase|nr:endo-1,4-beta-xylanase [Fibrobacterota bacterium]